jgi:hypothetical protein
MNDYFEVELTDPDTGETRRLLNADGTVAHFATVAEAEQALVDCPIDNDYCSIVYVP